MGAQVLTTEDAYLLGILTRRPHAIEVGELATGVLGRSTLAAKDRIRRSIARLVDAGHPVVRVKRGSYRLVARP
jgi:hypothetical protein